MRPFPAASVEIERRESYRNMKEVLDRYPEVIEHAKTGDDARRIDAVFQADPRRHRRRPAVVHGPPDAESIRRRAQHSFTPGMDVCPGYGQGCGGHRRNLSQLGGRFGAGTEAPAWRTGFCTDAALCQLGTGLPDHSDTRSKSGSPPMRPSRDGVVPRSSGLAPQRAPQRHSRRRCREPRAVHSQPRRRAGSDVRWIRPASGLVTALDPIMRATGGVWIAHGSGSGDRETADERGRLAVPPHKPSYTLRRIWLTPEEEQGYYYGFSNRALWPLCHIAYTRPVFDASDWEQYSRVNEKFAEAVLEEIEGSPAIVLVQDYHFALLPRMVKQRRPDAVISHFWHIPWPHREAFRICPWQEEILDGLLGSDLLGFHVQLHCNNFLETVDRLIESRVDYERFSVTRGVARDERCARFRSASTWKGSRRTELARSDVRAFRKAARAARRMGARPGRRSHGLHERDSRAPARRRSVPRALSRVARTIRVSADGRAEPDRNRRVSRISTTKSTSSPPQINAKHGVDDWKPIVAGARTPRRRGHLRRLSRGECMRGIVAARRHESRRQGIRRRPRRSTGRAHPLPFHRRRA